MSSDVEADLGRLHEVDASESKQGDIPGGRATEDDELCLIQQVEHLQNRLARAEAQSDAYLRAQESRLEWEAHRQNSQLQAQVLALESEIQRMSFQRMRDENDLVAQDLGECDALRRTCDKLSSENASNSGENMSWQDRSVIAALLRVCNISPCQNVYVYFVIFSRLTPAVNRDCLAACCDTLAACKFRGGSYSIEGLLSCSRRECDSTSPRSGRLGRTNGR
jgi:hypothetical protein